MIYVNLISMVLCDGLTLYCWGRWVFLEYSSEGS